MKLISYDRCVVLLAALTMLPLAGQISVAQTAQAEADKAEERPAVIKATKLVAKDEGEKEEKAEAEEPKRLTIGDAAPPLDIEHWVSDGHGKFSPVTEFEEGQVYVVEFWATWCGPCVASMPHLAETQEKLGDAVQLISISDESLEKVEGFLERPFKGGGDDGPENYAELTSAYCLTTDPDRSNHASYMQAAGERGIPTAFIVGKTGQIEWIGHPMTMDAPLQDVLDGSWDRTGHKLVREIKGKLQSGDFDGAKDMLAKAKETLKGANLEAIKQMEGQIKLMPISMMLRKGDKEGAVKAIEDALADIEGPTKLQLVFTRMNLLIDLEQMDKVAAGLGELKGVPPQLTNAVTWSIYEKLKDQEEPHEEVLGAAVAATEKAVEQSKNDAAIVDTLAHLVYLQGDLDRAIELETQAAEDPKADASIKDFLKKLKAAKEEAK